MKDQRPLCDRELLLFGAKRNAVLASNDRLVLHVEHDLTIQAT